MKYICIPCGYLYDEQDRNNKLSWSQLANDWQCPDCGTAKRNFGELDLESTDYDD